MADNSDENFQLLKWNQYQATSSIQDPLGVGLRGSARLVEQLLFCITSITPRARYYAFFPWCLLDWQMNEKDKKIGRGLEDAFVIREKALVLGCIEHHDGESCERGGLVGSSIVAEWYLEEKNQVDLEHLPFAKNPALDAYFRSLIELDFFTYERAEEKSEYEEDAFELKDMKLTALGQNLAEHYKKNVETIGCVDYFSSSETICSVESLGDFGRTGGLCELAHEEAHERNLLRNIFFNRQDQYDGSHEFRKWSLLLFLEVAHQLNDNDLSFGKVEFESALYLDEYFLDSETYQFSWPVPLMDIVKRWKMFCFHHYMAVALEALFVWVVNQSFDRGPDGIHIHKLIDQLHSSTIENILNSEFNVEIDGKMGELSINDFLSKIIGEFDRAGGNISENLDIGIRAEHLLSEIQLEKILRKKEFLSSPLGLAIPLIQLIFTLIRFEQWEEEPYGQWLANACENSRVDLVPPVLLHKLNRRFNNWREQTWSKIAEYVLNIFIIKQHQLMAYQKGAGGSTCLLEEEQGKIKSKDLYDSIALTNPRFGSAVNILKDLRLLEDTEQDQTIVTSEGLALLKECLEEEDNGTA